MKLVEADPLDKLELFVSRFPSQAAAARHLEVSQQHLCDLLHRRRLFSDRMLEKIGLRRTVVLADSQSAAHAAQD